MGIGELLLEKGGLRARLSKELVLFEVGPNIRAAAKAPQGVQPLGVIGLRQPSLDDWDAIVALKGGASDVETVIRCTFDPATNKPLFGQEHAESLRANAAGTWVHDVAFAVGEMLPKKADRAELGKGSAETPTSA
jgi:hypothetical protein